MSGRAGLYGETVYFKEMTGGGGAKYQRQVSADKLKTGDSIYFVFSIDLEQLLDLGGIEGLNNYVDGVMEDDGLPGFGSDLSYEVAGIDPLNKNVICISVDLEIAGGDYD
jgi:hypothetical protein